VVSSKFVPLASRPRTVNGRRTAILRSARGFGEDVAEELLTS
jgi:hypothetical protein